MMNEDERGVWEDVYRKGLSPPWVGAEIPHSVLIRFVQHLPRNDSVVLDFGCGDGRLATELEELGAHVVAADVALGALERAKPLKRGCYMQAHRIPEIEQRVGKFDGIVILGLLHHFSPDEWGRWISSGLDILSKRGVSLVGLFDRSDVAFGGKRERLSPTTRRRSWSASIEILDELFSQWRGKETGIIQLRDGGVNSKCRTWVYEIAQRP
jgi:SAM-dependent methyltransferase